MFDNVKVRVKMLLNHLHLYVIIILQITQQQFGGEYMGQEIDYKAAREARNNYAREWRAKNKEKVREANSRYWARRAAREVQAVNDPAIDEKKVSGDNDA